MLLNKYVYERRKFDAVLQLLGVVIVVLVGCNHAVSKQDVIQAGEIVLGGLFPIHSKSDQSELECGKNLSSTGIQRIQEMHYAIEKINNDDNILRNISLRARIFDSCGSRTIATGHTKKLINITIQPKNGPQLAGVIGASASDISAKVASILQVFEIPQISHASTSVLLSNKEFYRYFLRTVPPDSFQAQVMVDLCLKFGWSYVFTISSEGIYGHEGMKAFRKMASENGICTHHIATLQRLSKKQDFAEAIKKLIEKSEGTGASVVVLFCTGSHSSAVAEATGKTKVSNFTWIVSDAWDMSKRELFDGGLLVVQPSQGGISEGFKRYFKSLNVSEDKWKNNEHIKEFWEEKFFCKLEHTTSNSPLCNGKESLTSAEISLTPYHTLFRAVYAFAHALESLRIELCGDKIGMCQEMSNFNRMRLFDHLKNVSFQFLNTTVKFNADGHVHAAYEVHNLHREGSAKEYVVVATWDARRSNAFGKLVMSKQAVEWQRGGSNSTLVPESFCSRDCPFAHVKKQRTDYDFKCCWRCSPCDELQIIINNSCLTGAPGYIPNENRTAWLKRDVVYISWSDPASVLLIFASLFCIVLTSLTLLLFYAFRHHRTVKASGRELCYIMLAGIFLCFVTPFFYIAKPNDAICYGRKCSPGLALVTVYAALFMKLNRVYRVFTSASTSARPPGMVRPKSQILFTAGLILIQVLFVTMWFIAKPVYATETYQSEDQSLRLECRIDPTSFIISLSYILFLMVFCAIYAFKTRAFPKNFNESKCIGTTLYITCATCLLFFAFIFNANNKSTEGILIAGSSVVLGAINLFGLFGQTVYVILFINDARVDAHFKMNKLETGQEDLSTAVNEKASPRSLYKQNVIKLLRQRSRTI